MTRDDAPITLFVCLRCDRDASRLGTAAAEGRKWFKQLKRLFAGRVEVKVASTNCLGGCECSVAAGEVNGCCSVGLLGKGRYGYVLNQLDPEHDMAKVEEFVRRYATHKDGRLKCAKEPELKRHIATRLPPQD